MGQTFYNVVHDKITFDSFKSKLIDYATNLVYEKDPINKQTFVAPSNVKKIIQSTYDNLP